MQLRLRQYEKIVSFLIFFFLFSVLKIESRAMNMLGKGYMNKSCPQLSPDFLEITYQVLKGHICHRLYENHFTSLSIHYRSTIIYNISERSVHGLSVVH